MIFLHSFTVICIKKKYIFTKSIYLFIISLIPNVAQRYKRKIYKLQNHVTRSINEINKNYYKDFNQFSL